MYDFGLRYPVSMYISYSLRNAGAFFKNLFPDITMAICFFIIARVWRIGRSGSVEKKAIRVHTTLGCAFACKIKIQKALFISLRRDKTNLGILSIPVFMVGHQYVFAVGNKQDQAGKNR